MAFSNFLKVQERIGCPDHFSVHHSLNLRRLDVLGFARGDQFRTPSPPDIKFELFLPGADPFSSFTDLASNIAASIQDRQAVLDGEIVCLDKKGKPQFRDLLFHRGFRVSSHSIFSSAMGRTGCRDALMDRKQELRRLLATLPADSQLKYVDHVDGTGTALFQQVCKLDLEGVVAKKKLAPYIEDRENSTWFKIRNRKYSQMAGREELFERERHREPVPGWHSCVLACAELEEAN